jgi:hypothetical protein
MSLHLLILFVSFTQQSPEVIKEETSNTTLENNNKTLSSDNSSYYLPSIETNSLMYFISLLSPLTLFLVYYFNACIAQNIAITFIAYKNNYHKRIEYYKVFACITSFFLLVLAIFFNNNRNETSIQFSVNYYSFFYIGLFYTFLLLIMVYVLFKLLFIIKNRNQFTSSVFKNRNELVAINSFICQHTTYIVFFIVCYLPNNIIQLSQIFMTEKIIDIDLENRNYIFSFFIYFLSASSLISLVLKLNDPYMRKYIGVAFNLVTLRKNQEELMEDINRPLEKSKDISKILFPEENDKSEALINEKEMKDINSADPEEEGIQASKNKNSEKYLNRNSNGSVDSVTKNMDLMANTFDNLNKNLSISDHLNRLIAMSICVEREIYTELLSNYENQKLPWLENSNSKGKLSDDSKDKDEDTEEFVNFYSQKSDYTTYTNTNFPRFLKITPNSDYFNSRIKVRSYSPIIFSHIRGMDKISVTDLLDSLDFRLNTSHITKAFAQGGRSANPILYTYDKKYLIKTISKDEKNVFLKMLPHYHQKMGKAYSLLCRIYGLYRIKVLNKVDTHIIIMKNMNSELPDEVSIIYIINLNFKFN